MNDLIEEYPDVKASLDLSSQPQAQLSDPLESRKHSAYTRSRLRHALRLEDFKYMYLWLFNMDVNRLASPDLGNQAHPQPRDSLEERDQRMDTRADAPGRDRHMDTQASPDLGNQAHPQPRDSLEERDQRMGTRADMHGHDRPM